MLLLVFALVGAWTVEAAAQSSRATPTMRQRVYDKLSQASELAKAEKTAEAIEILRDVEKIKDLSPYEKAQLYTAVGYIEFTRDDTPASIRAYETVLAQEGLPEALRASTLYTLAQLYFQVERFAESVSHLEEWIASSTNPGPEPYVLLAQAHYQLEQYREGIEPVQTAIHIAEQRGRRVEESWYLLLRVFWYELENHEKVLEVLQTLVREYPRKEYWVQLGALYGEVGDEAMRVAAYRVAHRQGFLDRETEIVILAQLLMQANVPYRGAVVLARGLEDGLVEESEENLRLLSQAWTLAQEDRKAITALRQAAVLSDDGELDARLADAHANLAEWEEVVGAASSALTKGVAATGQVQLLLGMALFELGRFNESRTAFQSARKSADTQRTATQWVNYVDSEQDRLSELERSLRD
jgi:tetratricopeptide (TPR) repeat protein